MIELKTQIHTFDNGLRLVYHQSTSVVSHLGITFLAGSRFENKDEVGLAHFLEHCIFKGTTKRKPLQVLSRLDSVGGELNAFTTKEEICVYTSCISKHFDRAAELLADVVINANFPAKEIEKEKEIVLDELISYKDSPSDKIFDDFEAMLFDKSSLGNNILGTEESISSFDEKYLKKYLSAYFYAENAVISYVGSDSFTTIKTKISKYFGKLPQRTKKTISYPSIVYSPKNLVVEESNYQCHALIGGIAPGHNEEERRAMTLLINVLGGPALNSRLILSVREKYGYSYTVEAQYNPFVDVGYWSVYFGTDPKYLQKCIKLVHKEISKMREIPLTPKQLKDAKEQLKGHIALSLESNAGLMQGLGKSLLLFNQIDSIEEIYQSIDKITSEQIQAVANKYMSEEQTSSLIFQIKEGA